MHLLRRRHHRRYGEPLEARLKRGLGYTFAVGATVAVGAAVALASQAL